MSIINIIEINSLGDKRGMLFSLEENKNIPIEIKRVYYMSGMQPDMPRGFHAHKQLEQVAVCLQGSCKFIMDDGVTQESVVLDKPSSAIVIDKMIWHEMHEFSDDCILMVLANDYYEESDYIRDYAEFKTLVNL